MDGEICHTEGDGPGHRVVKPAPFPRRRVMASSPCGEWVAVEACAPGTIRVFRGVPAETADGTTKHVPITDRHGRELTLDMRPETRPEAHVLALEVVANAAETLKKKKDASAIVLTVFATTPHELRAFAIRRRRVTSDETHEENASAFECVRVDRIQHDTCLGVDRGRLVCLASNAKPDARHVAVVASRVARFLPLGDFFDVTRTAVPKEQDGRLGFHPNETDGPVVACAFLDLETEHRARIPTTRNESTGRRLTARVAAIGFEREIRIVRFFDGFPDRVSAARRVLVNAPGPVRSIAAHAGWIFASTDRKIALTSFGDEHRREPVNFAFARAAMPRGEKKEKKGASPDGSETAELGEAREDDASVVPFLRARLDPDAETRKLRDMVRPFLPAELRGIEPATLASRESEPSDDARATLQAFTFEKRPDEKSGSAPLDGVAFDGVAFDGSFVVTASLPLAPSSGARPEICALQTNETNEGGSKIVKIVVALADVGARNADAAVAMAELSRRAGELEARLAPLGTAPLVARGRGESHSRTGDKHVTRLEAFARTFINVRVRADRTDHRCGRSDVRDESSVTRDVALLTLLTSETAEKDSETARVAGANVFGGGARKKPARASPASLATFRVRDVSLFPSCPADSCPVEKALGSNANGVGDGALRRGSSGASATLFEASGGFLKGNETRDARAELFAERAPKPPGKKEDAADLDRVLDAIRALDSAVHARFDRVEATLQTQERRLRRVEESLKK